MKKKYVSNKELDVLNILWDSDSALTAKEINTRYPEFALSTIQLSLKNLIKKDLVKVNEIVYSGTVLTRNYVPTITKENYVVDQYQGLSPSLLLSELLGNDSSSELDLELKELEEIIKNKKRDLK